MYNRKCIIEKILLFLLGTIITTTRSVYGGDINEMLSSGANAILYPFQEAVNLFQGGSTPSYFNLSDTTDVYDYIVVGAGAAGAPLARTLADESPHLSVLLIERGSKRTPQTTPNAIDIYGAGIAVGDSSVSQLVITKQGVRTHIGTVMGGGTAINMAIVIEEEDKFFTYLESTHSDIEWDRDLVKESFLWINDRVSTPMPASEPYGAKWREGLNDLGYENNGGEGVTVPSKMMLPGYSWQGMSLFDADNGFYRNAADVLVGEGSRGKIPAKRPDNLTILTDHTVLNLEFAHQFREDVFPVNSSDEPRAVCVAYRKTQKNDTATINSRRGAFLGLSFSEWVSWAKGLSPLRVLGIDNIVKEWISPFISTKTNILRSCITPKGEIILSAGSILSPAILYKSGIGPRSQLDVLGIKPVKEVPQIGTNISDRVLIPVGLFHKNADFPTRICQTIGAKLQGDQCDRYEVGGRNMHCTFATAESLGGTKIAEHTIYATRFIFPPELRNHPVIDYIFNVIVRCSDSEGDKHSVFMTAACAAAAPVIHCFRKVIANFYFTAEPKSRGTMKMSKDGSIKLDPRYMHEPQDLIDAVRGVSNLVKIANGDYYKGIMQDAQKDSCPMTVLNSLLDILAHVGTYVRPELVSNGQFDAIEAHLHDLMPKQDASREIIYGQGHRDEKRRIRSYKGSSGEHLVDLLENELTILIKENKKYAQQMNDKTDSIIRDDVSIDLPIFGSGLDETIVYNPIKIEKHDRIKRVEQFNHEYDNWFSPTGQDHTDKYPEGLKDYQEYGSPKQWVASYPPKLPDPENARELAMYVLTYMTSIWHHSGSIPMGTVIENDFKMKGIESLSVVDASVLTQIPRMNPTATLMMLGRYAGMKKARSPPPF